MAAPLNTLCRRIQFWRFSKLNKRAIQPQRYLTAAVEEEETFDADDSDDTFRQERELEIRNVSKLSKKQQGIYHGHLPRQVDIQGNEYMQSQSFQRKMYAKYGKSSGLDPSTLWPTKAEISEKLKDEREWETDLHAVWQEIEARENTKRQKLQKREEKVLDNMNKMSKWIEEYKAKQVKAEDASNKKNLKRQLLLEEAREFYGYAVNPKDPKFKQMLEEKEKQDQEEKKRLKKQKKVDRAQAFIEQAIKG